MAESKEDVAFERGHEAGAAAIWREVALNLGISPETRPEDIAERLRGHPAGKPHPRGGPYPTLPPGFNAELARVIQYARGMVTDGQDGMVVGRYLAAQAHALPLSQQDLQCAVGYLISAAISQGRMQVIYERREWGGSTPKGASPEEIAALSLERIEKAVERQALAGEEMLEMLRREARDRAAVAANLAASPERIATRAAAAAERFAVALEKQNAMLAADRGFPPLQEAELQELRRRKVMQAREEAVRAMAYSRLLHRHKDRPPPPEPDEAIMYTLLRLDQGAAPEDIQQEVCALREVAQRVADTLRPLRGHGQEEEEE